jgi:hypothetical protein
MIQFCPMCREPKELFYPLMQNILFFTSDLSSFCLLLEILLKFCEKYEGRYKLIFVKKEYLIDIRKNKEKLLWGCIWIEQ